MWRVHLQVAFTVFALSLALFINAKVFLQMVFLWIIKVNHIKLDVSFYFSNSLFQNKKTKLFDLECHIFRFVLTVAPNTVGEKYRTPREYDEYQRLRLRNKELHTERYTGGFAEQISNISCCTTKHKFRIDRIFLGLIYYYLLSAELLSENQHLGRPNGRSDAHQEERHRCSI